MFAFNRADTLLVTLQRLQAARRFSGRPVYLFCDGPRTGREADQIAVAEVQQVLQRWGKTCSARLCFAERNRGLRASITGGVQTVLAEHDRVIVLEDDIVVSRSFLQYMDAALMQYRETPNIWQISGYFVPGFCLSRRVGFLRMPACWGWATWRDRWCNYNDNAVWLRDQVQAAGTPEFNVENSYHFFDELTRNAEGNLDTWHVRWYASMFLNQALAVFPPRSLTRNIGFDERGSNCHSGRMGEVYRLQSIWNGQPQLPKAQLAGESPDLLRRQIQFHKWQYAVWTNSTLTDRIANRLRRLF